MADWFSSSIYALFSRSSVIMKAVGRWTSACNSYVCWCWKGVGRCNVFFEHFLFGVFLMSGSKYWHHCPPHPTSQLHIHSYTPTPIYTYTHLHPHPSTHKLISIHTHNAHTHTAHTHTYTYTCTHLHIHPFTPTHTHTSTYTPIYT